MSKRIRTSGKHEDAYWVNVAKEREKTFNPKRALSHKDIWKSLNAFKFK